MLLWLVMVTPRVGDAQAFNLSFGQNGWLVWTNTVCSPCTCRVERATSVLGPWSTYTNLSVSNRIVGAFVPVGGTNPLFYRVAAESTLGNGLLGYWPLAGHARDLSGHGYDGTAANLTWATNRFGDPFASALFTNNPAQWVTASSHVAVSNVAGLCPTNSLSVTAWFNTRNANGRHIIAKELGSGLHDSFVLWFEFGSALMFQIEVENGAFGNVSVAPPPADGQWHFVAGTWDGQYVRLYLDGVLRSSTARTGSIQYDTRPIRIGADDNNGDYVADEGWNGLISEVRLYGRALSANEVTQILLLPW